MFSLLYIDDEPGLLEIGRLYLENTGEFSVTTVLSGREALDELGQHDFDAVVADYQMPEMDGIELLKNVRKSFGTIPFILFTGRGREEVVIEAINNGADFYLQKGGDPKAQFAELAHKIRQAVSRQRAETALSDSEKRLADIVNFLPDATFAIDRSGKVIFWNRAIEEMTGVAAADMLGKGDYEYAIPFYGTRRPILVDLIFAPDDQIMKNYAHISRRKDTLIADTTLPRVKGQQVTLMGKAGPLYNRQGEIIGSIESIRDITEREKAEEEALHAKKDWETIFRAIGHPALVLDTHSRILDANDATLRATGMSVEELKGKLCFEIFHKPGTTRPPDVCPCEKLKKTGQTETGEMDVEGLNGYYLITCTPVFDTGGKLEKVIHIAMDITERRRTQEELKAAYEQLAASEDALRRQYDELVASGQKIQESEERYRTLAEISPDAILVHQDGRIVYANPAALTLVGASRYAEIAGKPLMELIHPESRDLVKTNIESDLRGEHTLAVEVRMLRLDGQSVIVEGSGVLTTHEGRPAVQVAIRDVTDKKQYELVIREKEQKYRTLVETTGTGFVIVDAQGNVLDANPEYVRLTGHTCLAEIAGRNVLEWTVESEKEKNAQAVQQCVRDGFIRNFEVDYISAAGTITPIEINGTVIESGGGVRILTLCRDISERRKSQDAMRASEARFRAVIDQSFQFIGLMDTAGTLLEANRSALAFAGISDSDVINRPFWETPWWSYSPELQEKLKDAIRRAASGETVRFEAPLRDADGHLADFDFSLKPVVDPAGRIQYLIPEARDISERKRTEEQLSSRQILLDSILQSTDDGILVISDGGKVLATNHRFKELWRIPENLFASGSDEALLAYVLDQLKGPDEFISEVQRLYGTDEESWSTVHFRDGRIFERYSKAFLLEGRRNRLWSFRDITERKGAEKALRESEEKYRALIELSPDAVVVQRDGKIIFVNQECVRLAGAGSEQDLIGRDIISFIDPEYHPLLMEQFRLMEDGKTIPLVEERFLTLDGNPIEVEVTSKRILYEGLPSIMIVFRDITQRKRLEDEIRSQQQQLNTFMQDLPVGIFRNTPGPTGRRIMANPIIAHMHGYDSVEEFMEIPIADLYADPAERKVISDRLIREGSLSNVEIQLRKKNGDFFRALLSAVAVRGAGGTVEYFDGILRDITEEKAAQDALRESEEKYRILVEKSQDGIVIVQDERIAFINGALMDMIGYSEGELLGHSVEEFVAPEDAGTVIARHRERMSGRDVLSSYEYSLLHKDGSTRITVKMNAGVATYRGRPAMIATFQNVTTERNREAALRESEEKYRTLVESSFDGIAIHQDGIIVYANRTAARLLGSDDPAVFIGRSAIDLAAPAFRKLIAERVRQAPEKEQELIREQFVRLDGTPIDVDVTTTPTTWQGRPAAYVTFRDITAQVRAEEAFRESSRKYAELFELGSEAIFLIDNETGALLETNSAACEMYGYPRDILLTMKNTDLSAEQEETRKITAETRQGIVRVPLRYHRRKDGTVFPVEIIGRFFVWNGRPVHIAAIRDITEYKRAEAALRESEEKYRTLVEQSRDGVFIIQDDRLVFFNRELVGMTGYTAEELDGRLLADLIAPEDREMVVSRARDRAMGKEVPELYEMSLLHKGGARRTRVRIRAGLGTYRGRPASIGMFFDVTDDRRREEALRESEAKYRELTELLPQIVFELDTDMMITFVNRQAYTALGYAPDEMKAGINALSCIDPSQHDLIRTNIGKMLRKEPFEHPEYTFIRKDGSTFPALIYADPIFQGGELAGFRGIIIDISDRKRIEEALKESEARLSSILHGSPVLQFVIDRNHRVISWNRALEEYSGIRAADMIGTDKQWRAFYANKRPVLADLLLDGNTAAINRLYAGKLRKSRYVDEAYEATDFFPHMGSSGVWLSFTAAPIRDVRGTIIGAVETLEDVTERINAEKALRESSEWTRTILNTAQAGIILVDANTHRIVDANRKALELIGLDRDPLIGSVCHQFICPADEGRCPVTDCGQEVNTSERVLLTSSGEKIPVLKTVVRVSIGGRDILVESFVDISERKRSEDAIREANRKLNLLNSITRHDIRNQLIIAQGYTQLAMFSKPGLVGSDFLAKISAAVQTIQRQIEFTKEYQELGVHTPAWFMIRNVISTVRPEKIAVRDTCTQVEVFADPMIDKVFYNLFDNAMKYGERVTTVTVGCEVTARGLVITFADNGVGIPEGEKQKIFEKGYGRGTGFGLFLAREILAITGISIEETGMEGKGAAFEITVPKGAYRKAE